MNTRIFVLSLILCISCHYSYAERPFHKPDYKAIKEATSDESKPTYFPKLLKRYMNNDTTLTTDDYILLYYGYSLQPEYSSFFISPEMDSARKLLDNDNMTTEQAQTAVTLLKEVYEKDPFSLRTLFFLFNACNYVQNFADAQGAIQKATGIVKAMLTTGDGKTEETAIHVLRVSDEYMLINFLEYKPTGEQTLVDRYYDELGLQENKDGQKSMYFDIKVMKQNEDKIFNQPGGGAKAIKWH